MLNQYIEKDGKQLHYGYTTGSCSAAAAKAAAQMLFSDEKIDHVRLMTPKGFELTLEILEVQMQENLVSCGVLKDAGDDPDVTHGALVMATVQRLTSSKEKQIPEILIEGGRGVGRVTRPGLDQPVGSAAINSGPRKQIREALLEVCKQYGYTGDLQVIISIPDGEQLAEKTFNPKLGIVGGISVLGTTGIVEPMSDQALLDTILVELKVRKSAGETLLCMAPGNYGQAFLQKEFGFDIDRAVKCSNFMQASCEMVKNLGFSEMLFTGHLGKLIKVAAGIPNTHSKYGDGRMETIVKLVSEVENINDTLEEVKDRILNCVAVDDAIRILDEMGIREQVMEKALFLVQKHLRKWCGDGVKVEVILFSNLYGLLAKTAGAQEFVMRLGPKEISP